MCQTITTSSLVLPGSVTEALKAEARRRGTTASAALREALAAWLKKP